MNSFELLAVGLTAFIATSAMTLFSYGWSRTMKKPFLEPALLNELLFRANMISRGKRVPGWVIHYGIGFGFSVCYMLLRDLLIPPAVILTLSLGVVSGIIGVMGWHILFLFHPNPPRIERLKYYGHLLAAHVIFASCAVLSLHALLDKST